MEKYTSEILISHDNVWGRTFNRHHVGRKSIKAKGIIGRWSEVQHPFELDGSIEEVRKKLEDIEKEIMRVSEGGAFEIRFFRRHYYSSNWLVVSWKCLETNEEYAERVSKYHAKRTEVKNRLAKLNLSPN